MVQERIKALAYFLRGFCRCFCYKTTLSQFFNFADTQFNGEAFQAPPNPLAVGAHSFCRSGHETIPKILMAAGEV